MANWLAMAEKARFEPMLSKGHSVHQQRRTISRLEMPRSRPNASRHYSSVSPAERMSRCMRSGCRNYHPQDQSRRREPRAPPPRLCGTQAAAVPSPNRSTPPPRSAQAARRSAQSDAAPPRRTTRSSRPMTPCARRRARAGLRAARHACQPRKRRRCAPRRGGRWRRRGNSRTAKWPTTPLRSGRRGRNRHAVK